MLTVVIAEGRHLAKRLGCRFIEVSAKERINVDEAFYNLVREIRKYNKVRFVFPPCGGFEIEVFFIPSAISNNRPENQPCPTANPMWFPGRTTNHMVQMAIPVAAVAAVLFFNRGSALYTSVGIAGR